MKKKKKKKKLQPYLQKAKQYKINIYTSAI